MAEILDPETDEYESIVPSSSRHEPWLMSKQSNGSQGDDEYLLHAPASPVFALAHLF